MPSLRPEEHDFHLRDLPDDSVIWRYMDLSKFLRTLSTSSLHFASVRQLAIDDPYEGVLPPAYRDEFFRKWPQLPGEDQRQLCEHVGRAFGQTVTSPDDLITLFRNQYERLSRCTFVNCWYSGARESAAMWTLYATKGIGIAIKTTSGRLKTALRSENANTEFAYRLVCYYDQTTQELPNLTKGINTVAFLKRYSYAHESEYRVAFEVLLSDTNELPPGIELKCNINSLIERVVISPYERDYIVNPIADLLERYDLKCEAGKSPLMEMS